jgi:RimJ/RimL family protein N-acetyltransferase
MAQADVAIGAGGTSMIERFAMALPCVVVPIADNQRPGGLEAQRLGAAVFVDLPDAARMPAMAAALGELVAAPQALERMGQAAGELCDARGTGRVAAILQRLALVLEPAQASDATRLHEWRNHEATRRHSGDGGLIEWDAHLRWFDAVLRDPGRRIWIASLHGVPVGVVRLDTRQEPTGSTAVISVYRVPNGTVAGLGWGSALIAAGVAHAREQWPGLTRVDARISPDNEASLRAFAACGFTPGAEPGLYCSYLRSASP